MASRRKARIYAMQALFSWDISRIPLEELLSFAWVGGPSGGPSVGIPAGDAASPGESPPDVEATTKREETLAFSRLLVAGTIERIDDVDAAIQAHLQHWKIERLARVDLAILRLSTYSLLYQRSVPASVTIDEAVDLAREFGSDESYRFVNGVLDAIRKDEASTDE